VSGHFREHPVYHSLGQTHQTIVLVGGPFLFMVCAIFVGVAIVPRSAYRSSATSPCGGLVALVHGLPAGKWSVRFTHRGTPAHLHAQPPTNLGPRGRISDPADVLAGRRRGVVRLTLDVLPPWPPSLPAWSACRLACPTLWTSLPRSPAA